MDNKDIVNILLNKTGVKYDENDPIFAIIEINKILLSESKNNNPVLNKEDIEKILNDHKKSVIFDIRQELDKLDGKRAKSNVIMYFFFSSFVGYLLGFLLSIFVKL